MKRAIFLTAYDRPEYLRRALESWDVVRGLEEWQWFGSIEPSPVAHRLAEMFEGFLDRNGLHGRTIINETRQGVLHHPWVRFEELFQQGFDFVVRVEDDFRVSTDTLEYFTWASDHFMNQEDVASVHGFTRNPEAGDPNLVVPEIRFDPLLWGTWRSVWQELIGPTWDHDYSTNNGTPGVQAGWDWNLNTRIYPKFGLHGIFPESSRVDNFGVYGTHSTPDNFYTAASFREDHGEVRYRLAAQRSRVDIT